MASQCQKCQQKFNFVRSKHNCKVCGRAVCKTCSFKDVILYLPDNEDTTEPRLSVIKIIGVSLNCYQDYRGQFELLIKIIGVSFKYLIHFRRGNEYNIGLLHEYWNRILYCTKLRMQLIFCFGNIYKYTYNNHFIV